MTTIKLRFNPDELERFNKTAKRECRSQDQQARYMVLTALGLRGESSQQENPMTKDQQAKLKRFAIDIVSFRMGIDGGDVQDIAVNNGILIPTVVHTPCGDGDHCSCAECCDDSEFAAGVTCYRLAEWVKQPKPENV